MKKSIRSKRETPGFLIENCMKMIMEIIDGSMTDIYEREILYHYRDCLCIA